jgi:hypothetical protein
MPGGKKRPRVRRHKSSVGPYSSCEHPSMTIALEEGRGRLIHDLVVVPLSDSSEDDRAGNTAFIADDAKTIKAGSSVKLTHMYVYKSRVDAYKSGGIKFMLPSNVPITDYFEITKEWSVGIPDNPPCFGCQQAIVGLCARCSHLKRCTKVSMHSPRTPDCYQSDIGYDVCGKCIFRRACRQ